MLKPCCLPQMVFARQKRRWTLGDHSFAAADVCMAGKYNKGVWKGLCRGGVADVSPRSFWRYQKHTTGPNLRWSGWLLTVSTVVVGRGVWLPLQARFPIG